MSTQSFSSSTTFMELAQSDWSLQNPCRFDYSSPIQSEKETTKPGPDQENCPDVRMVTPSNPGRLNRSNESKTILRRHMKPTRRLPFGSMLWHSSGRWSTGGGKTSVKKSFVWKYFFHPELSMGIRDLTHTQCLLCQSQLAFNTSGTTTTMLNHLKSRHGEVVELEQCLSTSKPQQSTDKERLPSTGGSDTSKPKTINQTKADHAEMGTANTSQAGSEAWWTMRGSGEVNRHLPVSGSFAKQRRQRGRPPGSGKKFNHYLSMMPGAQAMRRTSGGRRDPSNIMPTSVESAELHHPITRGPSSSHQLSSSRISTGEPESILKNTRASDTTMIDGEGVVQPPSSLSNNRQNLPPMGLDKINLFKLWTQMNRAAGGYPNTSLPSLPFLLKSPIGPITPPSGTLGLDKHDWLEKICSGRLPHFPPFEPFPTLPGPSTLPNLGPMLPPPPLGTQLSTPRTTTGRGLSNGFDCTELNGYRGSPPESDSHMCVGKVSSANTNPSKTLDNNTPWVHPPGSPHFIPHRYSAPAGPDPSCIFDISEAHKHWVQTASRLHHELAPMLASVLMNQREGLPFLPPPIPPPPSWFLHSALHRTSRPEPIDVLTQPLDLSCSIPTSDSDKYTTFAELTSSPRVQRGSTDSNRWNTMPDPSYSFSNGFVTGPHHRMSDPGIHPTGSELFPPFGSALKRKRTRPIRIGGRYSKQVTEPRAFFPDTSNSCHIPEEVREITHEADSDGHSQSDQASPLSTLSRGMSRVLLGRSHQGEESTTPRSPTLTAAEFRYRLAYFLIRDCQPPEVVEDDGFKALISTLLAGRQFTSDFSDQSSPAQPLPTAQVMREHILQRLYKHSRERLHCAIADSLANSHGSLCCDSYYKQQACPNAVALSVEWWQARATKTSSEIGNHMERTNFVDIKIHWHVTSSVQEKQIVMYATEKISDKSRLMETIMNGFRLTQPQSTEHDIGVYPIVTNCTTVLSNLLQSSTSATEWGHNVVLIPCIVHALLSSFVTALELPPIAELLQVFSQKLEDSSTPSHTTQREQNSPPHSCTSMLNQNVSATRNQLSDCEKTEERKLKRSSSMDRTDFVNRARMSSFSDCEITQGMLESKFVETYKLLSEAHEQRKSIHLDALQEEILEELFGTIHNMRKTILFIKHGKGSVSASMIKPILLNMRHSRLIESNSRTEESNDPESKSDGSPIDQFKQAILTSLDQFYPGEGPLEETLLLSSLMDPRFKSCLLALCPESSRLLRLKLECIFEKTAENNAMHSGDKSTLSGQINTEMERYLREASLAATEDSVKWWKEQAASDYPHLFQLALRYLAIPLVCGRYDAEDSQIPSPNSDTPLSSVSGHSWPNYEQNSQLSGMSVSSPGGPLRRIVVAPDDVPYYSFLWYNWRLTSPRDLID